MIIKKVKKVKGEFFLGSDPYFFLCQIRFFWGSDPVFFGVGSGFLGKFGLFSRVGFSLRGSKLDPDDDLPGSATLGQKTTHMFRHL